MSEPTDWKARAEREAAVILGEVAFTPGMFFSYEDVLRVGAMAWLQGMNLGSHETLALVEQGFDRMKAEL